MRTFLKRAIGATSVCALAAGMVLGANAFTKNEEMQVVKTDPELKEWHFNGTSNSEKLDASKYSEYSSEPCGGVEQTICIVLAPEDTSNPGQPNMSHQVTPGNSVASRINSAIPTIGSPSTNETVTSLRSF